MPIYNDETTDKNLKYGYWFVTHKVMLHKLGILILAAASGALLLYGAWGVFDYYILSRDKNLAVEKEITSSKLNYALLSEINKPKNLQVLSVSSLNGGEGKVDLVAEVANPNVQWAVESFDYHFFSGERKTAVKSGFILPGHTKFVLDLGFASLTGFPNPELSVENIKWKKTANFKELESKVIDFDFANKKALSAKRSGASAKSAVSTVEFDVINRSAYSFSEPKFIVLFYGGGNLVGADQAVLDSLVTGETKNVNLNIFQDIPAGAEVRIYPDINILDPAAFKGFDNH